MQKVHFDGLVITGDRTLSELNDEELFAAGIAAFAAKNFTRALLCFDRIGNFYPHSPHYRQSLYKAGLAFEQFQAWEGALVRFSKLASAVSGKAYALDAAFHVAQALYHLERYEEAIDTLRVITKRTDLPTTRRLQAQVQQGVCQVEMEQTQAAETTFRRVLRSWKALPQRYASDNYFPAQAQFFLGEIYRLHYESTRLNAELHSADSLAETLEYKSQLLLSAQGHYLRTMRIGNGYWATAAGQRIGLLYEDMYNHVIQTPIPAALAASERPTYRAELRKKISILIRKAIIAYERTLEAVERIGTSGFFVAQTRLGLKRMKDLLLAQVQHDAEYAPSDG